MVKSFPFYAFVIAAGLAHSQEASQSNDERETGDRIETIEVIGVAPLSIGQSVEGAAANVQAATAERIAAQRNLDLADFIKRNLASVFVNEAQNNPLQPDVQYRGYVGSPLLGLPQGIAVYQDAVRINEPFGDTVNWALIPESAIDTAFLLPGSNPLFGLNALGGAISIETKDGFSHAGTDLEVTAGSFSRVGLQASTGGSSGDRFAWFAAGALLDEDGWRDFSPTQSTQAFTKLSWRSETASLDLGISAAGTDLVGNGAVPVQLLAIDRDAIYTRPDRTRNDLAQINLVGQKDLTERLLLTGNVYLRRSDIDTLNGDDSDYEECQDIAGFLCIEDDDEEELVFDGAGDPVVADESLEGATVNRTATRQDSSGFGMQLNWFSDAGDVGTSLIAGLTYDESDIGFNASTELGTLDATRLAIPGGVYVGDGYTGVTADVSNAGLYLSGTFRFTDALSLTAAGRYNGTSVTLVDRLGTALNGDHDFDRFNPSVGMTYRFVDGLSFYASYSEANRAPTPVELTCADEDDPCRLPNAFLADPPLEQVVATTYELGARGRSLPFDWHAGYFRTSNDDDILFISAGALTSEGYFDNVGKTRREGVELSLSGAAGSRLTWFAHYTYLDATFETAFAVASENHPDSIDGEIAVEPGDVLPLVPDRLIKAGLNFSMNDRITLGADLLDSAGQHLRGDEGNIAAPVPGYTVFNMRAEYEAREGLTFFALAENLLDERYSTFGVFGEADEVLGDDFGNPRFLGPAAPRGLWLGVDLSF